MRQRENVIVALVDIADGPAIGDDVTAEAPLIAEQAEEEMIGAGGLVENGIVGAHDGIGVAIDDGGAEGGRVRVIEIVEGHGNRSALRSRRTNPSRATAFVAAKLAALFSSLVVGRKWCERDPSRPVRTRRRRVASRVPHANGLWHRSQQQAVGAVVSVPRRERRRSIDRRSSAVARGTAAARPGTFPIYPGRSKGKCRSHRSRIRRVCPPAFPTARASRADLPSGGRGCERQPAGPGPERRRLLAVLFPASTAAAAVRSFVRRAHVAAQYRARQTAQGPAAKSTAGCRDSWHAAAAAACYGRPAEAKVARADQRDYSSVNALRKNRLLAIIGFGGAIFNGEV